MKKANNNLSAEGQQSEADQFIDFARRLISVPKSEIDKQQAKYEREKQKRKKEKELAEEN